MAIPPPPTLAPHSSKRWLWWIVGGVPLLLILGGAGGLFWLGRTVTDRIQGYRAMAATLPEEIAGAKSEGLALTAADLRRKPPLSPNQNAATFYRKIDKLYRSRSEKDRQAEGDRLAAFLKPTRTTTDRANAKAALVRNAELIQLTEQAAALPDCDFQRPWEQGMDMLYTELATMRHLDRLLAARATLEKEEGHPEAALRDIAIGARVSIHAGQDPAFIPYLVQIALRAIMNRPFVEILQEYGSRPDILRQAEETEKAFGPAPDLHRAFQGELVVDLIAMEQVRHQPTQTPGWMKDLPLPLQKSSPDRRATFADACESRIVSFWRQAYHGLQDAPGDLKKQADALARLEKEDQSHKDQAGYEMNAILMPAFEEVSHKMMYDESFPRLRQAAVALLAYRATKGSFPESLAEAPAAAAVQDPFTDTSLIYRKTKTGFLLYSVGPNLKDDNGDETKDAKHYPNDVVFRYPK